MTIENICWHDTHFPTETPCDFDDETSHSIAINQYIFEILEKLAAKS